MEVDLYDMRSGKRILVVIGRGGTLQLHLPIKKYPLHYLAVSQILISMAEMRDGISHRNITTRPNTATRLTRKEFYDHGINHQIAIRELVG